MKAEDCKLHQKYKSKINIIATGCEYEVVKKNKTSCWVHLWEDGKPTNIIYKNVRYSVLALGSKNMNTPKNPSLQQTTAVLSLANAKQIVAEKFGKNDWDCVKRDYEYGMGISKLIDFEELMDKVAEVYKANKT